MDHTKAIQVQQILISLVKDSSKLSFRSDRKVAHV